MDYAIDLTTVACALCFSILSVTNLPSIPNNNWPTGCVEHWQAIAVTELVIITRCRCNNTIGLYSNHRCYAIAATIYVPPWETIRTLPLLWQQKSQLYTISFNHDWNHFIFKVHNMCDSQDYIQFILALCALLLINFVPWSLGTALKSFGGVPRNG